jgi:hypothetical protein
MPDYDEHVFCIACLGDFHAQGLCPRCQKMPQEIRDLRQRAQIEKTKLDRSRPNWQAELYAIFPQLLATQEAVGKRSTDAGEPPAKRPRSLESEGAKDQDTNQPQGTGTSGGGGTSQEDLTHPPGVVQEVDSLKRLVHTLRSEINTLSRASLLREHEEMLDEDDDVRTNMSKMEKRAAYLETLRSITPNLLFPQPVEAVQPSEDAGEHFKDFSPREEQCIMPFCQPLLNQLAIWSRPPPTGRKTPKDPFKMIDKFYKTVSHVENSVLSPRAVPSLLLDEVKNDKLQNPGASGLKTKLKKSLPEGQKEVDSVKELSQASSFLRVVNSQELGIQAMAVLIQQMGDHIDELSSIEGLPQLFATKFSLLQTGVQNVNMAVDDLKLGNTNLAKCVLHQYVEAVRDRRQAWVDSSNLPPPFKSELTSAALDILEEGADEPLCLLNSRSVTLIKENNDKKDKATLRHLMAKGAQSVANSGGGGPRGRNKKKKNNNQKVNFGDLTPAAHAAGWGGHNPSKGRGKGQSNRGGNKAGRGRGQPFSSSAASTSDK